MNTNASGLPFDDIRNLLTALPKAERQISQHTAQQVAESFGDANGVLADLCIWYSSWSGRSPAVNRPVLTLFAGTHEVDRSGDEALLSEVGDIASGNAGICRLCHEEDMGLKVIDLALQIPVADITQQAALDEKSCAGTIAFGMEAIAGGPDLICISAIENHAGPSALALLSLLLDTDVSDLVYELSPELGRSTLESVKQAIERAGKCKDDPLELLRQIGGRETAAICGAILAARTEHVPVILSGPSAIASAALLARLADGTVDHCRLAQSNRLPELDEKLCGLGLKSVLSQNLGSTPAAQAVIAANLVKSAARLLA